MASTTSTGSAGAASRASLTSSPATGSSGANGTDTATSLEKVRTGPVASPTGIGTCGNTAVTARTGTGAGTAADPTGGRHGSAAGRR